MRQRLLSFLLMTGIASPAIAQTFPVIADHQTSEIQDEAIQNPSLGAADTSQARLLSRLSLDLIRDFEKWVPYAYNDASNYCTIGYGHLIARKSCEVSAGELSRYERPMTLQTGLGILDNDTGLARFSVANSVKVDLNDEQFGALASFVFNVGAANFQSSTMLKFINNGEFEGAVQEFPKWVRSKGVVLNGLVNRRSCEAELFKGTLAYRRDGSFHREDCTSLGAAPATEDLIDIDLGEGHR